MTFRQLYWTPLWMWCTEFGDCFQALRRTNEKMFYGSHWGTFQGRDCTIKVCLVCTGFEILTFGRSLASAYRTGFMIFITCTKKEESSITGPYLKLLTCCATWKDFWYFSIHLVCFSFKPNTVLTHEAHFKVRFLNYAGFKWKQFNFLLKWHPDFVPSCIWMNVSSDSVTTVTSFWVFLFVHFPPHIKYWCKHADALKSKFQDVLKENSEDTVCCGRVCSMHWFSKRRRSHLIYLDLKHLWQVIQLCYN